MDFIIQLAISQTWNPVLIFHAMAVSVVLFAFVFKPNGRIQRSSYWIRCLALVGAYPLLLALADVFGQADLRMAIVMRLAIGVGLGGTLGFLHVLRARDAFDGRAWGLVGLLPVVGFVLLFKGPFDRDKNAPMRLGETGGAIAAVLMAMVFAMGATFAAGTLMQHKAEGAGYNLDGASVQTLGALERASYDRRLPQRLGAGVVLRGVMGDEESLTYVVTASTWALQVLKEQDAARADIGARFCDQDIPRTYLERGGRITALFLDMADRTDRGVEITLKGATCRGR